MQGLQLKNIGLSIPDSLAALIMCTRLVKMLTELS